jgi:hypothetical protein
MSLAWSVPHGIMGRSTLANDTPGQTRFVSYVSQAGVETNEPQRQIRLFNDLGAAAVVGRPYVITFDGNEEQQPKASTPATAAADQYVVVAVTAVPDQTWGWYACAGYVNAQVDGDATDVSVGDFLTVTNAIPTAFTDNTTARTTDSFAIACEANTGAAVAGTQHKILLFGDPADIDA